MTLREIQRACLYRTCKGSCRKMDRFFGWTQLVPSYVCRMCLSLGGPLNPETITVRHIYRERLILDLERKGPAKQRPLVVAEMIQRHLPPQTGRAWLTISAPRLPPALVTHLSDQLPP